MADGGFAALPTFYCHARERPHAGFLKRPHKFRSSGAFVSVLRACSDDSALLTLSCGPGPGSNHFSPPRTRSQVSVGFDQPSRQHFAVLLLIQGTPNILKIPVEEAGMGLRSGVSGSAQE